MRLNFGFTSRTRGSVVKRNLSFQDIFFLQRDTLHANDTLIKDVEIYGHPDVDIGPDLTVKALSYTLDAGSGLCQLYLGQWHTGPNPGNNRIRNLLGTCYWMKISVIIMIRRIYGLKIRDIRPDGFASPVSDCRFTTGEPVSLRILNSGTDTVPSGQHITVGYVLNEGARMDESFDLSVQLLPGEYTTHTLFR